MEANSPFEVLVEAFYDKYSELKRASKSEDDVLDDLALFFSQKLEAAYEEGFKEGVRAESDHWLGVSDRGD